MKNVWLFRTGGDYISAYSDNNKLVTKAQRLKDIDRELDLQFGKGNWKGFYSPIQPILKQGKKA